MVIWFSDKNLYLNKELYKKRVEEEQFHYRDNAFKYIMDGDLFDLLIKATLIHIASLVLTIFTPIGAMFWYIIWPAGFLSAIMVYPSWLMIILHILVGFIGLFINPFRAHLEVYSHLRYKEAEMQKDIKRQLKS